MFSLMMGLGVSGLSAGLRFSTGFASGFVEELGGGFESCAIVQPPQEQVRQIAPIRCKNLTAILPPPCLSRTRLDVLFARYDRNSSCRCHFRSRAALGSRAWRIANRRASLKSGEMSALVPEGSAPDSSFADNLTSSAGTLPIENYRSDSKLLQNKRGCEFFSIVQISLQLRAVPSSCELGTSSTQPPSNELSQHTCRECSCDDEHGLNIRCDHLAHHRGLCPSRLRHRFCRPTGINQSPPKTESASHTLEPGVDARFWRNCRGFSPFVDGEERPDLKSTTGAGLILGRPRIFNCVDMIRWPDTNRNGFG